MKNTYHHVSGIEGPLRFNRYVFSTTFILATVLAGCLPTCLHAQVLNEKFSTTLSKPSKPSKPSLAVIDSEVFFAGDKTSPCRGAGMAPDVIDLSHAIDLTLCNNPKLKSTWAAIQLQAAAAAADEARTDYFPALSAANRPRAAINYADGERDSASVNTSLHSGLNWRIADSGTREADRRATDSLFLAALATHDAKLQTMLANTIQAYFDAQTARAAWLAKQSSEQIARDTLAHSKRRNAPRKLVKNDIAQAMAASSRTVLEMHRAGSDYRKSLVALARTMGLPSATPIRLADEAFVAGNTLKIDNIVALNSTDLQAYLQQARAANPVIQAAREKWRAAQSKLSASLSESSPTVDVSANYYRNTYPGQASSASTPKINAVGIALNIPIFDGFSRNHKITQAKNLAERGEEDLVQAEQTVVKEVIKAHADAVSTTEQLRDSEAARNAASQALIVSRRQYTKGIIDITEMLLAQTRLEQAQLERIRSLAQWRSARLRLVASMGVLGTRSIAASTSVVDTAAPVASVGTATAAGYSVNDQGAEVLETDKAGSNSIKLTTELDNPFRP